MANAAFLCVAAGFALGGFYILHYLLYFIIALFATTVGALTGMGGGVIMKPVLDALGQFDTASINLLSSITVLSMAVVSVGRNVAAKAKVNYNIAIPLAVGAAAGGIGGKALFELALRSVQNKATVTVVQNAVLAVLILLVILYMRNKHRLPTLGLAGLAPSLATGLFLGCVSAFLGIGGGPINVALIVFVFSMDTKSAAISSLVTILFSQIASLASHAVQNGFAGYSLTVLPAMVVGAILGGFLGARLQSGLNEHGVERAFNAAQILIFALCIFNIFRTLYW